MWINRLNKDIFKYLSIYLSIYLCNVKMINTTYVVFSTGVNISNSTTK